MKAKVIIEECITSIVLSAENDFERDIVEKIADNRKIESKTVETRYDQDWGVRGQHRIVVNIKGK